MSFMIRVTLPSLGKARRILCPTGYLAGKIERIGTKIPAITARS